MKFDIVIEEKLKRIISIDANSLNEAIEKVEELYKKEEIILDYSDFESVLMIGEENYVKEKNGRGN